MFIAVWVLWKADAKIESREKAESRRTRQRMGHGKPTDPELELSCVGQKWPGCYTGFAQLIASGCPENTVIGTKAEMDRSCHLL